jgi:hypothetical protein
MAKNRNNSKTEKFDSNPSTVITSTYEDIIDTLSVSPSASNPNSITWQDQLNDYVILFLKYAFDFLSKCFFQSVLNCSL